MNKNLKIIVVDDHPIFLKGLVDVLSEELPNSEIISCKSSKEALNQIIQINPNIAIFDLDMPEMNGIELARAVRKELADLKIIMLTMHKESEIIQSVMSSGINGYVFKDDAVNDLVLAIESVFNGEQFISKSNEFLFKNNHSDLMQNLTKTECVVLKLIAEQKTSKAIANFMFVSPKTIDNHRSNISKKLDITGSNSLIKFAINNKKLIELMLQTLSKAKNE